MLENPFDIRCQNGKCCCELDLFVSGKVLSHAGLGYLIQSNWTCLVWTFHPLAPEGFLKSTNLFGFPILRLSLGVSIYIYCAWTVKVGTIRQVAVVARQTNQFTLVRMPSVGSPALF